MALETKSTKKRKLYRLYMEEMLPRWSVGLDLASSMEKRRLSCSCMAIDTLSRCPLELGFLETLVQNYVKPSGTSASTCTRSTALFTADL
jgi:hypothetical protein